MLYYPISALINAIASTIVCLLAITKNPRSPLNRSFSYFAFSVAFWSYCYFFWQISKNADDALFWCRVLMAGAIFIPPTFFHFSLTFIHKSKRYWKRILFWYAISAVFLISNFTPLFVNDVRPRLGFVFWPTAGLAYAPFLLMFFGLTLYAHILMYKGYKEFTGFERNRIKYVFLGTAIGFIGGSTNYLLWYDIPIPPLGNALVAVYVVMVAYATIKYRFMDITVFTVRGLILAVVYLLVLGIPFWVGFKILGSGPWIIPCVMIAVCATAGPFIYNFFRYRAEQVILRQQKQYQRNLLQLSKGMTRIKELDQLLRLIVRVVSQRIKIKSASIFLKDKETGFYVLKASRHYKVDSLKGISFNTENVVVQWFDKRKGLRGPALHTAPLVYEEIRASVQHGKENGELVAIETIMKKTDFDVIVPSFVDETLLGFLALGGKSNGQMYSDDDLNVFSILTNQAALAIENAIFYQETGKTLVEKFQEHRVWSIGKMGAGIGHQMNNRLNNIKVTAEVILEDYLPELKKIAPHNSNGIIADIEDALKRMSDDAKRGGEVAKILNTFSKKSDKDKLELLPIDIEEAIKGALNLLSCKIQVSELNLRVDIPSERPKVLGNLSTLQDVFFNMLDNTHDAFIRKQNAIKECILSSTEAYEPKTIICARVNQVSNQWEIELEDNGIGMTEEDAKQLFIPFFTKKATSEKGTGLGLGIIKQMIEAHGGAIKVTSKYSEGTKFAFTLPVAK